MDAFASYHTRWGIPISLWEPMEDWQIPVTSSPTLLTVCNILVALEEEGKQYL